MSYRNPKSTSKDISGVISTSLSQARQREEQQKQRQSKNINTLIGSVDSAITGSLDAKRKAMRKLDQSIAKSNKKIYKQIDGIGLEERGDQFDEMTQSFLGEVVTDFGNVNRAIADGSVDSAIGRNDKAVLKNVVNTFATSYPQLLAVYDQLEASAKKRNNGETATTLSITGPYADQLNVIKNIKESSPGISFERTPGGGVIVKDNTDPKNPQTLDLNEFSDAMKKNKFLKFVPDLSKPIAASYNNIMDDKAGKATFTSFDPNSNDENTAVLEMDVEKEKALKNKMTGDYLINSNISIEETRRREDAGLPTSEYKTGGQFRTMIENYGDMIWEDIMPQKDAPEYPDVVPAPFDEAVGKPGDGDYVMSWDDYYKTYKVPMMDYLAEESIQKGTMNGNIRRISKLPKENKATEEANVNQTEVAEDTSDNKGEDFVSNTASTIFDYESKSGSGSGTGLKDFGFTDSKYANEKYDKYRDKNGDLTKEGAVEIFEKEYMSQVPNQYPENVKQQLADWKFNSGRSILDLLLVADGKLSIDKARNEGEHKDMWAENKSRIEKEIEKDPIAWNEKIKEAKRGMYKELDPKKYENTWKNRIDMFDGKEEEDDITAVYDNKKN